MLQRGAENDKRVCGKCTVCRITLMRVGAVVEGNVLRRGCAWSLCAGTWLMMWTNGHCASR